MIPTRPHDAQTLYWTVEYDEPHDLPKAKEPARMKHALARAQARLWHGGLRGLLRPWNVWNWPASDGRARISSVIAAQNDAFSGALWGHSPSSSRTGAA